MPKTLKNVEKVSMTGVNTITVASNKHDDMLCQKHPGSKGFECFARNNTGNDIDIKKGVIVGVKNVVSVGLGVTNYFDGDDGTSNILIVPVGKDMKCTAKKNEYGDRGIECNNG